MTMSVHELEAEVLRLAATDRARILERLIESFDRDTKIGEAWLDEALRREEEVVTVYMPSRTKAKNQAIGWVASGSPPLLG